MQNISFSILIPVVIFFGICAAAFFYRLIRRMPFDISLRIKETCPHCKKPVPVLFQIPFLGILFARFRYACCDSKMSKKIKELLNEDVACIMMTNPNTLGIFDENIFCKIR